MPVVLRRWQREGQAPRVYVNGHLEGDARLWLQRAPDGGVEVHAPGSDVDAAAVLAAVRRAYGLFELDWDRLERAAAGPPPKAGRDRRDGPRRGGAMDEALLDMGLVVAPLTSTVTLWAGPGLPDELLAALARIRNLSVERRGAGPGDLGLDGHLLFARLAVEDLAALAEQRRVAGEAGRLARSGVATYVLVEGDLYGNRFFDVASVSTALATLAVLSGASVIPTLSPTHTAHMVARIVRETLQGPGRLPSLHPMSNEDHLAALAVVGAVPGVGPSLAKALLARFGSVRGVAEAGVDALADVPGLTAEGARAVVATLQGRNALAEPGPAA